MTEMHKLQKQRQIDLVGLLRALYSSASHEEDKERLELHRLVAVELSELVSEAINKDRIFNSDVGLNLIIFIELKADGESEAEAYRKDVEHDLQELESRLAKISSS